MSRRINGEGSIYKVGDNKWRGRLTIGRDSEGKFIRKSVFGSSKPEVAKRLRELAFDQGTSNCYDPTIMTVKEWLTFWIKNIKRHSLKQKTYEVYEIHINFHLIPGLGHLSLKAITAMHIQKFINDKFRSGLASATIRKMFGILSSSLKHAVLNDMLHKNPAGGVVLPIHTQKEIRVFTPEDQDLFFEFSKKSLLNTLFVVAVDTGLRLGEILALTWNDIDERKATISVTKDLISVKDYDNISEFNYILKVQDTPKTKSSIRKVPLTGRALAVIKAHKEVTKGVLVFSTRTGNYLAPKNVERAFCGIVEKAKLGGCNFHTLRHTFATRLFELGTPPKIVSEYLGHSKVSHTLDIYTHVIPDLKSEAIKVLDLYHDSRKKTSLNGEVS